MVAQGMAIFNPFFVDFPRKYWYCHYSPENR